MTQRDKTATPTTETYEALQTAYDLFNETLFHGELKPCLITLQRRDMRTLGYYWPQRFVEIGGKAYTDEIAMNPQWFTRASLAEVLSTLVHEQVHLWQFHFGNPSRNGYHNKEWSLKMIAVGLFPSSTGALDGKKTGQHMSHYIIEAGVFNEVYKHVVDAKFTLKWGEIIEDVIEDIEDVNEDGYKKNKSNRVKYCCGGCGAAAWGKPKLNIICGECNMGMEGEGA